MRHEQNIAAKQRARVPRATASFLRSGLGKTQKRWLYLYQIDLPAGHLFLPSDELLRALTERLPMVRFKKSKRFTDRDTFFVYGLKGNPLTTRAPKELRKEGRAYLEAVAALASPTRDTPEIIIEGCRDFCTAHGFRTIEWTGGKIIAYSNDGHRFESTKRHNGEYERPLKALYRLCEPHLPFLYRTATR